MALADAVAGLSRSRSSRSSATGSCSTSRPSSSASPRWCGCAATTSRASGEDVTYDAGLHAPERSPEPPVAGFRGTLGELSELLEPVDLYGGPIGIEGQRQYRRWAWESAALDLALRQANLGLGDLVERQARPVSFVASTRIDAATLEPLASWTRLYPRCGSSSTRPTEWDDALAARVGGLAGVDVVDLKGQYRGHPGRQRADGAPVPARGRGVPRGVDRGPEPGGRRGRGGRARAAPRPDHLGRADPLGRRRGRACRSRRGR